MWLERRYPPGRFHRCAKRCNACYVSLALLKTTYLNSISLMCFPGGYPALGDGGHRQVRSGSELRDPGASLRVTACTRKVGLFWTGHDSSEVNTAEARL